MCLWLMMIPVQAGITEPSGGNLYNELMKTRERAVGAPATRDEASRLQVCLLPPSPPHTAVFNKRGATDGMCGTLQHATDREFGSRVWGEAKWKRQKGYNNAAVGRQNEVDFKAYRRHADSVAVSER